MRTVYFDYNATTPLDAEVREAMLPFLADCYGNPSSVHHVGRRIRALLDDARDQATQTLGCKPSELIFTSGGTEANNLAVTGMARDLRPQGRHLITSPTEHPAVLHTFQHLTNHEGFELTLLPVDRVGCVDPDAVAAALRPDTVLVSVMTANNETGSLQPARAIGRLCRERNVLFHTDAVQSLGKESFQHITEFEADLVTICPHKFHGPKGVGALYVRSPLRPQSLFHGGSQEQDRRAGTENLPGIIGLVAALERFLKQPVFPAEALRALTQRIVEALTQIDRVTLVSPPTERLPNTVSFLVEDCDNMALIAALDLEGICASSGSACSAGSVEPSHVLLAQGYDRVAASSFVRFSLGRESTSEEVDHLIQVFPRLVGQIRDAGRRGGSETA